MPIGRGKRVIDFSEAVALIEAGGSGGSAEERGSVAEKSRGHFSRMAAVTVVAKGNGFEGAFSKSGGEPQGGDDVLSPGDVVLEPNPRLRQPRPTAAISEGNGNPAGTSQERFRRRAVSKLSATRVT